MLLTILKRIAAAAVALVLLCGVVSAAVPLLRHFVQGWWNSPEQLAALPECPQVHFERGAVEQARTVAAMLPGAIARIEAVQGRRFAHSVTVGVYVSPAAFAAANGLGIQGVVGTTFLGRVLLSPVLFTTQRQRLPAILTHELSHAHLRSWLSQMSVIRLPNWFKEGLAVMASGGGGAEGISEAQARDAMRQGDHIAIADSGSWFSIAVVKFASPPEVPDSSFRVLPK